MTGLLRTLGAFGERRPVRDGLLVAGLVFVVFLGYGAASGAPFLGYDAHAYYNAAGLSDPYRQTIQGGFDGTGGLYEYKYPPPLAQVLAPLHLLPWPAFFALWSIALLLTYYVLAGRWALYLLFFPAVLGELYLGNINLLIAAAIVAGFRWPAAWAFIIVTKMTPGVGLLWFAVRREWRSLGVAIAASAVVAIVSYVLAPGLWSQFVEASRTQLGATVDVPRQAVPLNLPVRLALAAVITVAGALKDRRWAIPIAAAIAVPFAWWNVFAILVACVPLASPSGSLLGRVTRAPVVAPGRDA